MPNVVVGARTDVGRHRSLNEDALLLGERVWVVADGMGGHAAGDVASRLAVQSLRELDEPSELTPAQVTAAVLRANAALESYAGEHPEALGMGTTVTGLAEVSIGGEPHWAVFNVGDSRVYRYAGGELRRVSVDHSEVEELVAQGLIDAEEARTHPARHIITRSVGMRPAPAVDLWVLPQVAGERFLLCSDGLNSELPDERIAELLAAHGDPRAAASALVDAVLGEQARDNVTVAVIDVRGDGRGAGDEITVPRDLLEEDRA
ncbi:MAG: serine/threonine-protein phosphatase [Micropruina sp.]|nr:serine/threonine-protein phosphatase [Micropruina sp.]